MVILISAHTVVIVLHGIGMGIWRSLLSVHQFMRYQQNRMVTMKGVLAGMDTYAMGDGSPVSD
jgi:tellurite resistance protein TehA-like permease